MTDEDIAALELVCTALPKKNIGKCIVPKCSKKQWCRHFCQKHYAVWYRRKNKDDGFKTGNNSSNITEDGTIFEKAEV